MLDRETKKRLFNNIMDKVPIQGVSKKRKGKKTEEIENSLEENISEACSDLIATLKADQGKLHHVIRIKTEECEQLTSYASSLERDLLNIEEGKNPKLHQLVFN